MTKSKQTILVTGINGFVGEHLTNELVSCGHEVVGTGIQEQASDKINQKLKSYVKADLTNPSDVDQLNWDDIDSVIHLAGLSDVGASFGRAQLYMHINTAVIVELFESAMRANKFPRVIAVSTGAVYKPSDECITEDFPTQSTSPYGASKLASEHVVDYYRNRGFEDATSVRPFNHIGPGQGTGFIVSDLASQIHEADNGDEIKVGNLLTSRDYTDVRDVVRAYRMLCEADSLNNNLYNICSSKSVKGTEIFAGLVEASGKTDIRSESEVTKLRPTDVAFVCGSNQRIKEDAGWEPEIPLEQTLADVIKSL